MFDNITCGRDLVNFRSPHFTRVLRVLIYPQHFEVLHFAVRHLEEYASNVETRLSNDEAAVEARTVGAIQIDLGLEWQDATRSADGIVLSMKRPAVPRHDPRAVVAGAMRGTRLLTVPAGADRVVLMHYERADVAPEAG